MDILNINDSIERYLIGALSKEEELLLLETISSNPQLSKELELRRRTNQVLTDMSIISLRGKLDIIEMKRRETSTIRQFSVKAAKYAAVVAGVAIMATSIYLPVATTSSDKLYDRYFRPYQIVSPSRSVRSINNALFASAMEAMRSNDFHMAVRYLEQIVSSDPDNIESSFYLGVADMETKDYKNAEISFKKVIDQNENLFVEDASWYLGLCYMITDEKQKALRQFEYIASTKSKYSKDAKKLVRKLN